MNTLNLLRKQSLLIHQLVEAKRKTAWMAAGLTWLKTSDSGLLLLWLGLGENKKIEGICRRFRRFSCETSDAQMLFCEWFVRAFPEQDDWVDVGVLSFYLDRFPKTGVSPDAVINVYLGPAPPSTESPRMPGTARSDKFRNRRLKFMRKQKELKQSVRRYFSRHKVLCVDADSRPELIVEQLAVVLRQVGITDKSIDQFVSTGFVKGAEVQLRDEATMEGLQRRFVDPGYPGDYLRLKGDLREKSRRARKRVARELDLVEQPVDTVGFSGKETPFEMAQEESLKKFRGEQSRVRNKPGAYVHLRAPIPNRKPFRVEKDSGVGLTIRDACARFDASPSFVRRCLRDGRIRHHTDTISDQLIIPFESMGHLETLVTRHNEKQRLSQRKRDIIQYVHQQTGQPYSTVKKRFNRYLKKLPFEEATKKLLPPGKLDEIIKRQADEPARF